MNNLDISLNTLYKYFSGQCSEEEIAAILTWLEQDSLNKTEFINAKKLFIETTNSISNSEEKSINAFKKLEQKIEAEQIKKKQNSSKVSLTLFYKYAAVFVLFLGLTVTAYIIGKSQKNVFNNNELYIVDVPYGGKSNITLPDGSTVHLNAGSKLKYSKNFGVNSRELYLEGEGLFEVEKHKFPMTVHTSHIDINVLGTVFNIKSYSEEENIETTLLRGSIRVETPNEENNNPIYLKPNEMLVFNKKNSEIAVNEKLKNTSDQQSNNPRKEDNQLKKIYKITSNVDVNASIAWKDGKYVFTGETLAELAKILERKFDINFSFENDEMKSLTYSGTIGDYPIEQVLEALSLTSPVVYDIKEKNVFLALNKEKMKTYHVLMNN